MTGASRARVVVVTGASRNIGFETARALTDRGYQVAMLSRDEGAINKAADQIGKNALPIAVDVSDRDALFGAFERVAEHFGRVDGLVNNAGIAHLGKIASLDPQHVQEQVSVNFLATVYGCQGIVPHLRKQGGGRIVNVSSAQSQVHVFSYLSVYAATKAAVNRFSEELRHELEADNIKVTTFIPGETTTSFGFGWNPALVEEAYQDWLGQGTHFSGSMEPATVGKAIARCFDVEDNSSYDLVLLRPSGRLPKAMLPQG